MILALERRQEGQKFRAILSYIMSQRPLRLHETLSQTKTNRYKSCRWLWSMCGVLGRNSTLCVWRESLSKSEFRTEGGDL